MPAIRTTKKKSTKSASGPYAKSEQGVKTEKGTKVDPSNGTYDRVQMFSDIVRGAKPDWPQLAQSVNKSVSQCKDIWRKVVLPALLDGREWSAAGNGAWDTKAKIEVLATVLKGIEPDWQHVAAAQGRTVTQVKDMWRKVLQPKLLKGGTIS